MSVLERLMITARPTEENTSQIMSHPPLFEKLILRGGVEMWHTRGALGDVLYIPEVICGKPKYTFLEGRRLTRLNQALSI